MFKVNVSNIVKLTEGFESNISKNANRKRLKYLELAKQLREKYKQLRFVNLSFSAFGFLIRFRPILLTR